MNDSHKDDIERLRRALLANGESPEEADSLAQVGRFLDQLPPPPSRVMHRQQTLELLAHAMPPRKSRVQRAREWYPVALLLSQAQVIQREIWLASAFVLALGLVVTLIVPSADLLAFSALAPIVAAVGIAMLYDADTAQMLEIETTTRASARLLLLARLTLIFGFDLGLALVGSAILALFNSEVTFLPLVLSWLAPMTFLSGLAFFLGVLLLEPLAAGVFSLVLWMVHLLFYKSAHEHWLLSLIAMPGLADAANRPLLLLSGVALIAAALWMVDVIERRPGESV